MPELFMYISVKIQVISGVVQLRTICLTNSGKFRYFFRQIYLNFFSVRSGKLDSFNIRTGEVFFYNSKQIQFTPKQEMERKSEWFCGVNFFRSNFEVE